MKQLNQKVAVITGGTTGIGLATAKLFIEEGAKVIVTGRTEKTLAEAKEFLGPDADVVKSDTSSIEDTKALFAQIKEKYGRVDVLFANAGVAKFLPFEYVTPEGFDETFNINVKGLFFTVQSALPLIPEGGSVILNASVVASKGFGMTSVYSATKAAVRNFGRTLAAELAPKGIRVNTVSPGPVATPIYNKLGMDSDQQKGFEEQMASSVALKRFGRPEEIATAVLFFATPASSYVTGAELLVDGGLGGL